MNRTRVNAPFLRRHVWWPLAAYVAAMFLLAGLHLDLVVARVFHDSAGGGWVARDAFWANGIVHAGGGYAVRAIGLGALLAWALGWWIAPLARYRRTLLYFVLALALTNGLVGLLKQLTNVDCPWDLAPFGGRFPYVPLLADRPDELRHAACFPGAHSASGFALVALYFVLRDCAPRRAWLGLAIGLCTGAVFAFAQEARGAHFLSHDLTSAAIAWYVSLVLYALFQAPIIQSRSTTLPALRPASRYSTASAADSSPVNGVGSTSARSSPR